VAILAAFALCVFVQSATTALVGDGTAAGALAAAAGVTATAVARLATHTVDLIFLFFAHVW
jgi:hypothetical protein